MSISCLDSKRPIGRKTRLIHEVALHGCSKLDRDVINRLIQRLNSLVRQALSLIDFHYAILHVHGLVHNVRLLPNQTVCIVPYWWIAQIQQKRLWLLPQPDRDGEKSIKRGTQVPPNWRWQRLGRSSLTSSWTTWYILINDEIHVFYFHIDLLIYFFWLPSPWHIWLVLEIN